MAKKDPKETFAELLARSIQTIERARRDLAASRAAFDIANQESMRKMRHARAEQRRRKFKVIEGGAV